MQLEGSVALVSGGASGLGRATAEALDRAGADVVVLDLPGAADRPDSDRLTFAPADVRDEDAVTAAVAVATERGPVLRMGPR
jgi:NAD(P)-dependent dehydrogenase (short-subunit alcohol dehydrogenase family)